MNSAIRLIAPGLLGLALALPAVAGSPAARRDAQFEQDRQAILAMAGDFEVDFRFEETLNFDPASRHSEKEISKAFETVRVVEDRGTFISLQHLLVSEEGEKGRVVKHWRQDWTYEDRSILEFRGKSTWQPVRLSEKDVKGTWSQSVWQVDDSPRYEGYGKWVHVGEYAYWDSSETWRPLPRRESSRKDDYDVLVAKNRHSITPEGWAHEQDNYKLKLDRAGNRVLAREAGLNTYKRIDDFDFAPALAYWEKTAPFWALVRARWDAYATQDKPVTITPDAEMKTIEWGVSNIAKEYGDGKYASVEEADQALGAEMARYVTLVEAK
jgi:hypothetical protein